MPDGFSAYDTININTARFAEVWLDEYKQFYYYMNPAAKNVQPGDLTQRLNLKNELRCHSAKWFLDHVYTDHSLPYKVLYTGQIQHMLSQDCLDAVGSKGEKVAMKVCHGLGGFQTFLLSKYNEIKTSTDCMTPKHSKLELFITSCDFSKAQKWLFKPILDGYGQIVHQESEKCMSFARQTTKHKSSSILHFLSNVVIEAVQEMDSPILEECNDLDHSQLWSLNLAAKWH
jgi:polypeptide N-acetylgalactosaminyltransferase